MDDLGPHLLRGPSHFFRNDAEELRQLFPETDKSLPRPWRIFLENETATPLHGFPILLSSSLRDLQEALSDYILAEEQIQVAILKRRSFDHKHYGAAWETYRKLLRVASENVITSDYGRFYPEIFWLYHSWELARLVKETPKRIRRLDLAVGRERGDELKYTVLFKYLDRAFSLTYDLVQHLAADTEEDEEQLFPALLTRMRDNVLIFSEDHISASLSELASYFQGYLQIDGRTLQYRLALLSKWHAKELARNRELRDGVQLLFGEHSVQDPNGLLRRPGYLSYLAIRSSYDHQKLLGPDLVQVWESLLLKLKEFEVLHALRRLLIAVDRDGDRLVCGGRDAHRIGGTMRKLYLSPNTRPLDFMSPWVVDPQVSRCGMIYDISNFSATISLLRRADNESQHRSFRGMFLFQRRVNRLGNQHRLRLEKYLGDGAFYSGRDPRNLLIAAIKIQRYYRQALQEGFAFNRGMRIALNFGEYRLLPVHADRPGEGERYEFFGHGIVELSRLVSGKSSQNLDDTKTMLVSMGYPEATVNRFFDPVMRQNIDLVDKLEEAREFYAYINRNGVLINEGIVATAGFIDHLEKRGEVGRLFRIDQPRQTYAAILLEDSGEPFCIGVRKLGMVSPKGLERLPVYEIVDGSTWQQEDLQPLQSSGLREAVDGAFASTIIGRKTG